MSSLIIVRLVPETPSTTDTKTLGCSSPLSKMAQDDVSSRPSAPTDSQPQIENTVSSQWLTANMKRVDMEARWVATSVISSELSARKHIPYSTPALPLFRTLWKLPFQIVF